MAGTGTRGKSGDDGPAADAQLNDVRAIAVTADGGFLIADAGNRMVRKVAASGQIVRVAGTGTLGGSGDDGPASDAELTTPIALAATPDGGFLIVDFSHPVVRKVWPSGIITRVAGTGISGTGGDDGPATEAQLVAPYGIAATLDGGFLIADGRVVRRVSATGIIARVAGSGAYGNSGDDGPATEGQLMSPAAVAVTPDGGFLVVDADAAVVRRVSPEGRITRVAGVAVAPPAPVGLPSPPPTAGGDDGPATEARFSIPVGVAATADGGFLIVDREAHTVRKVWPSGIITRVAGTGVAGTAGDDGPAADAELTAPVAVAMTADGGFLIADESNRVRKVWP